MSSRHVYTYLRIALGFVFLWAFLDKLFGLGFSTAPDKSWLMGVSPTTGFLSFATEGIFGHFFKALAGSTVVDVLFMGGLLGIGSALILGIGVRIARYAGTLLMALMYLSLFPPENNPLIDEHIIYILVIWIVTCDAEKHPTRFGKWWTKQTLVKKWPILR